MDGKDLKESPVVKEFKEEVYKDAEHRVLEVFPQKILKFKKILEGSLFNVEDLSTVHWDHIVCQAPPPLSPTTTHNGPSTCTLAEEEILSMNKKRKVNDSGAIFEVTVGPKLPPKFSGIVPCNAKVITAIDTVKPEILGVMDNCNVLKIWIQLSIPKIEDGNNFGVSIQEDVLAEVTKAEADAGSYLEQICRYFSNRAKLVSKVAKYPYLDDYRRSINEFDEKAFLSFKLICRELRNIYIVLYDVVAKNYEKLKKPRSENSTALY